uniref:DDIT3 protein n=1 Tax=Calidris pygmaea TaxID=425635 RepID=A0A8C3KG20_9CHAR
MAAAPGTGSPLRPRQEEDLQEVLAAAAEPDGPSLPWGAEQAEVAPLWGTEGSGGGPEGCELAAALAAELLGPESAAGTEPVGPRPLGSASSSSPPARELAKHRERANEQRVLELTAHNEQLREEIQRLSAEVERTRAALIDHIVNLQRN